MFDILVYEKRKKVLECYFHRHIFTNILKLIFEGCFIGFLQLDTSAAMSFYKPEFQVMGDILRSH